MIAPTVGTVVHYHPSRTPSGNAMAKQYDRPLAAIITAVWSDTCVNLTVFDANGTPHGRTSVLLVQEDNPIPSGGLYCEWTP